MKQLYASGSKQLNGVNQNSSKDVATTSIVGAKSNFPNDQFQGAEIHKPQQLYGNSVQLSCYPGNNALKANEANTPSFAMPLQESILKPNTGMLFPNLTLQPSQGPILAMANYNSFYHTKETPSGTQNNTSFTPQRQASRGKELRVLEQRRRQFTLGGGDSGHLTTPLDSSTTTIANVETNLSPGKKGISGYEMNELDNRIQKNENHRVVTTEPSLVAANVTTTSSKRSHSHVTSGKENHQSPSEIQQKHKRQKIEIKDKKQPQDLASIFSPSGDHIINDKGADNCLILKRHDDVEQEKLVRTIKTPKFTLELHRLLRRFYVEKYQVADKCRTDEFLLDRLKFSCREMSLKLNELKFGVLPRMKKSEESRHQQRKELEQVEAEARRLEQEVYRKESDAREKAEQKLLLEYSKIQNRIESIKKEHNYAKLSHNKTYEDKRLFWGQLLKKARETSVIRTSAKLHQDEINNKKVLDSKKKKVLESNKVKIRNSDIKLKEKIKEHEEVLASIKNANRMLRKQKKRFVSNDEVQTMLKRCVRRLIHQYKLDLHDDEVFQQNQMDELRQRRTSKLQQEFWQRRFDHHWGYDSSAPLHLSNDLADRRSTASSDIDEEESVSTSTPLSASSLVCTTVPVSSTPSLTARGQNSILMELDNMVERSTRNVICVLQREVTNLHRQIDYLRGTRQEDVAKRISLRQRQQIVDQQQQQHLGEIIPDIQSVGTSSILQPLDNSHHSTTENRNRQLNNCVADVDCAVNISPSSRTFEVTGGDSASLSDFSI